MFLWLILRRLGLPKSSAIHILFNCRIFDRELNVSFWKLISAVLAVTILILIFLWFFMKTETHFFLWLIAFIRLIFRIACHLKLLFFYIWECRRVRTPAINLKCTGCDTFLLKVTGRKKIVNEANAFSLSLQRIIVVNDILYKKYWFFIYKKKNPKKDSESETERDPSSESDTDDPTFEIQTKENNYWGRMYRNSHPTVATHKYCCICLLSNNLTTIPEEARISAYIKKKSIYHVKIDVVKVT